MFGVRATGTGDIPTLLILPPSADMYTTVLPARDRVPTEIWETIFSMVIKDPEDKGNKRLKGNRGTKLKGYSFDLEWSKHQEWVKRELPTMVFDQICTRWRTVVRESPRLWRSISVELSSLPIDVRELLEMYFIQSKDCPLEVSITLAGRSLSEHGLNAWDMIKSHLPRCRFFTLDTREIDTGLPIHEDLSFPILESFDGSAIGLNEGSLTALSRAFQRAPKLAHLTSLSIPSLPGKDVGLLLTCLSACEQLQSLTIHDIWDFSAFDFEDEDSEPDELVPEELIMPCLRRIRILEGNGGGPTIHIANELLKILVMPALLEFEFANKQWPGTGDSDSLHIMSRRSPLLERVALHIEQSDETEDRISPVFPLLSFLYNLPQLRNLSFTMLKANTRGQPNEDAYSLLVDTALSRLLVELSQHRENDPSGMTVVQFLPRLEFIYLNLTDIVVADPTRHGYHAGCSGTEGTCEPPQGVHFCSDDSGGRVVWHSHETVGRGAPVCTSVAGTHQSLWKSWNERYL
ncbi:hypothetical protein AAF712_006099 [Marasmius tenuissimus]|uniref:F-box domain-containing protein n=1 Tax=Marasmius tenuissimus TaxID=585030 RepID=A0ABR3A0J0_9AGAR